MLLTLFALLLLLAGTACLLLALPPTKTICDLESPHRVAWRWLGAFILLFLAGYLYYCLRLLTEPAHLDDLLLALTLAAEASLSSWSSASAGRRSTPSKGLPMTSATVPCTTN